MQDLTHLAKVAGRPQDALDVMLYFSTISHHSYPSPFYYAEMDPDNASISSFDWWSKYYYSIDDKLRTEKDYVDKGHDQK